MRDVLREAAHAQGEPELADLVLSLVRPAVALEPGEGGAGVYGGLPPLPDGVEWPTYRGRALTPLMQLDCAAVAALYDGAWPLPRDGVLLFFYDDAFGYDNAAADEFPTSAGCRVLHVSGEDPRRPAPDGAVTIPPLPLRARPALSAPDHSEPVLQQAWAEHSLKVMDVCNAVRDALPEARHLLLGWTETQVPGGHGRPLLQVAAEEGTAWGETCALAFLLPEEDLAEGRLDRVRYALDVA